LVKRITITSLIALSRSAINDFRDGWGPGGGGTDLFLPFIVLTIVTIVDFHMIVTSILL
jgi:hypothetical protein